MSEIRRHRVVKGETLATISAAYYHDPSHWSLIYRHNSHYITDPNRLDEGVSLVIPHIVNPHLKESLWL